MKRQEYTVNMVVCQGFFPLNIYHLRDDVLCKISSRAVLAYVRQQVMLSCELEFDLRDTLSFK